MALVGRGLFYGNVASVAFTMGIVNYILCEWGDLDFSEVMTVNLDEYKGLSRENDQSYYYFMHRLMMCQSRHTRWESRPLCRPRRFL